jgi:hypothetical protein
LLTSNANAFNNWSTTITREAMMIICTMIRMLLGVCCRTALIAALEQAVTDVRANAMINEVDIWEVTAKAEQTPNTCKVMGLLSTNGSNNTFLVSLSIILP